MNRPFLSDRFSQLRLRRGESGPALLQLFRNLWRRKGLIFWTAFGLTFLSLVILLIIPPYYTAQTLVVLEPQRTDSVGTLEAIVAGLPADDATIESEAAILSSRGLATKVVEQLELDKHPEINLALVPPLPVVDTLQKWFDQAWDAFGNWTGVDVRAMGFGTKARIAGRLFMMQEPVLVDQFISMLTITPVGRSRAIQINFVAHDGEMASRVTDALANAYIVSHIDSKFEAMRQVSDWLMSKVQGLRDDVEAKEKAAEDFRKSHDLLVGRQGDPLVNLEITDLNTQIVAARASRAEAEARLTQIREIISRGSVNLDSAQAVLESPLIVELRKQESLLAAQVSDFRTRYGDRHPEMRKALASLSDTQKLIDREVRKIAKSLENAVAVSRSREDALMQRLASVKQRVTDANSADVQMRSLMQEAETSRSLLESFLQGVNNNTAQQEIMRQQPDARIVSHAEVPWQPSFPKRLIMLLLAAFASGLAGVGLAVLLDLMDTSFRSSEQIETETGIRVLGHVPQVRSWWRKRELVRHVAANPGSIAAEAVRRVGSAILIGRQEGALNRILFTSAQPGEGKTSIAVAVSRMLAAAGQKVLLVDSDIRQSKVHNYLGLAKRPGLTEYLCGECTLEEAIQTDAKSGLHVISAGVSKGADPQALLASERLKVLLDSSAKAYDLVILDSAPVSAVADPLLLSRNANTIFVVKWGGSPRNLVTNALYELVHAGATVTGVILSQVDPKKHVKYGYADSAQYSRAIKKYYAKA